MTAACTASCAGAGITTLIVTGGETDIRVLATVMGAVDLGYRVVMPSAPRPTAAMTRR